MQKTLKISTKTNSNLLKEIALSEAKEKKNLETKVGLFLQNVVYLSVIEVLLPLCLFLVCKGKNCNKGKIRGEKGQVK